MVNLHLGLPSVLKVHCICANALLFDAPVSLFLFSFFFLLCSFLVILLFHVNLQLVFFPGNNCDQIETLAQCAERSQFVVDYFLSAIRPLLGFLGRQTFHTVSASYL